MILKRFVEYSIGTQVGKLFQIVYGLYLDFAIWNNLRHIGCPYPLWAWILFWISAGIGAEP